jgi:phenylacetic acid degradation operon negative regulatory protein
MAADTLRLTSVNSQISFGAMRANGFEAQPQDLVMTFLGAYVVPHDRVVWSGGLVALLGDFGFSIGASRVALARMVRRGGLERLRSGRLVSYRPTPRTVALLEEGDRRIFSLGREPHRAELWTALWHAIPEERRLERGRLARRLRFLGFGSVQDGTWISPHDREREVVALIDELGVGGYAGVMVGRPAAALDFRALVSRAWDLEALDERYRAFTDEFSPSVKGDGQPRMDEREAFLLRTRLVHAFRRFPALDPELPDELMHAPRHRAEAVALFHRLYAALAPTAQRHFDAVTSAP